MNITFTIEPDIDADNYKEMYSCDVEMEDGTSFTVRATEDEVSYSEFRADIFEDLFRSLAETMGITLEIEEEDYAAPDAPNEDVILLSLDDYLPDEEDRNGC